MADGDGVRGLSLESCAYLAVHASVPERGWPYDGRHCRKQCKLAMSSTVKRALDREIGGVSVVKRV